MKVIVYSNPDGTVAVVRPALGARLAWNPNNTDVLPAEQHTRQWRAAIDLGLLEWAETEDEFAARIMAKDVPAGAVGCQIVDSDAVIPADRTFRNAWRHDGSQIGVDMPSARLIHKDRLRQLRGPKLAALDVEYQRADERGDSAAKADVAKRKQALRDITAHPAIEAATTPDALKIAALDILSS